MLKYDMQSRKKMDFLLWFIALVLKKHGLLKTNEGQEFFKKLQLSINKNRYLNKTIIPGLEEILKIITTKPIYGLSKTHEYNYRNNRQNKNIKKIS
jgi:hypothetical protein